MKTPTDRAHSAIPFDQVVEKVKEAYARFQPLQSGAPASYIPELAKVNADDFAISVTSCEGKTFSIGTAKRKFTLQSASKPFTYGLALEDQGRERVLATVGVEPSGEAFNSIIELEKHTHLPFNPMINSGAIAISHLIRGKAGKSREARLLDLFGTYIGRPAGIDPAVYRSEKDTAHRNRAIASLLRHFNVVDDEIEASLDLYFKQCSVLVDVEELSAMAATLASGGIQPITKKRALSAEFVGDVICLMFTCGMYDTAGTWAYRVGIPAKSGVSGVIFGVVPNELGIAVYSPRIDGHGHSVRGVQVFESLSKELNLHLFRRGGA